MAESIAVEARLEILINYLIYKYSAWGQWLGSVSKGQLLIAYNNMKMSSNEVILIATHTIDLGKAFIDPSNFICTESASDLLATDAKEFTKKFGSHFLAGCTTECSM